MQALQVYSKWDLIFYGRTKIFDSRLQKIWVRLILKIELIFVCMVSYYCFFVLMLTSEEILAVLLKFESGT